MTDNQKVVAEAKRKLGLSDARLGKLVGVAGITVRRWHMPETASNSRKISETAQRVIIAAMARAESTGWRCVAVYPDSIDVLEVTTDHPASSHGQPVLIGMAGLTDVPAIIAGGGHIEAERSEVITRGLPPDLRDAVKQFRAVR